MNKINFLLFAMSLLVALTLIPFPVGASFSLTPNGSFETGDTYTWSKICGNDASVTTGGSGYLYVYDGLYKLQMSGVTSSSAYRQTYCTSSNYLTAGTWDINFSYGIASSGGAETFWLSAGSGCAFANDDSDSAIKKLLSTNWATDRNSYRSTTLQTLVVATDSPLCFTVSDNTSGSNNSANTYIVDYVTAQKRINITPVFSEPSQPINPSSSFILSAIFYNSITNEILTNSDISATLNFNSEGANAMTYAGSGVWTKTISGHARATYPYTVIASGTGFNTNTTIDSVTVDFPLNSLITATAISNASLSLDANALNIVPQLETNDVVFKIANANSYGLTATPTINISNSQLDNGQYFIYTSTNGTTWVFSDTLTFGATSSTPIQKIWNTNTQKYVYSFTDSVNVGSTTYYKLVYTQVPFAEMSLIGNSSWLTVPNPDSVNEGDNIHTYDVFNDSNYTNLQIYSIAKYSELTGGITNKGYELQFTAYADTSPQTLKVGYRVGNTDTTTDVNLTTTKTRYSFPINTTNFEAQMLIKTTNTTSNRVYISDYALVPRSYFVGRLEIFNSNNTEPLSIVRSGVSTQYIQEGVPFKFNLSTFDQDKTLKTLRIDATIDNVPIKSYYYDLTNKLEKTNTFFEQLAGVIDYNGTANTNGVLNPFRNLIIKATLINTSDQNVAEQYKTISLMQYPYFPSDVSYTFSLLNKKVGTNPSLKLSLTQKQVNQLIGLQVIIYDSDHNKTNPNYSELVYVDQLGCASLYYCQKTLTVNNYKFPEERSYNIGIALILRTENQNFNNVLTNNFTATSVSYSDFETARVLQLFERRNGIYNNVEQIPLVLQLRDTSFNNLKEDFTVYLKVDLNNNNVITELNQQFMPEKFIYSPETGYNYYFFNNIFFNDDGSLIPDGNKIKFKAYVVPTKGTQASAQAFGLVNKCVTYPSDSSLFDNSWLDFLHWDVNAIKTASDVALGCEVKAPSIVEFDDLNATQLTVNASYLPSADSSQSLLCFRNDQNFIYKNQIGDQLVCIIFYKKDEEQIDDFKIKIGNENSDYSVTDDTKQYIEFVIPQEQIMFNDVWTLTTGLQQEFNTDKISTYRQVGGAVLSKLISLGQIPADFGQILSDNAIIKNVGFDVNLDDPINPQTVNGMFFIAINGLQVTNFNDYIADHPDLETFPTSKFIEWAKLNNVYLPNKTTTIKLISNDIKTFDTMKVISNLVINEKATIKNTNGDINAVEYENPPVQLKFDVISDMESANQTKTQRALFSIFLTYVVPAKFSFTEFFKGIGEFLENPVQKTGEFLLNNWFLLVLLLAVILIGSVVYANFKVGGGNISINNHLRK
jgi:hypothetical protein